MVHPSMLICILSNVSNSANFLVQDVIYFCVSISGSEGSCGYNTLGRNLSYNVIVSCIIALITRFYPERLISFSVGLKRL